MAKKQVIRLTESDLHRIIKESVKNVLKENNEVPVTIKKTYTSKKGEKLNVKIVLRHERRPHITSENIVDMLVGGFEYWVNEYNENNTYIEGELTIIENKLVDYDGSYYLPKAVGKALIDSGFTVDENFF